MSPLISIPQAVVELLAAQFAPADVARAVIPRMTLDKPDTPVISVFIPSTHRGMAARGRRERIFPVNILIASKVASLSPTDVDPAIEFADSVADAFGPGTLDNTDGAFWVETDHVTLFDTPKLLSDQVFVSQIIVTYQLT